MTGRAPALDTPLADAPRVCWNAIVKDEVAVLHRLLPSLASWIDYWVVCDTESTDDTPERIRCFFDDAGIPGELHRTTFGSFGRARYVGATHEALVVEGPVTLLDGIRFLDHADGANRPGKSERDIALLEAALADDPGDLRSLFYLAQSLRDAGRLDEAIDAYSRRAAAGGFE